MKLNYYLSLFSLLFCYLLSNAQQVDWAKSLSTSNTFSVNASHVDADGNYYLVGNFFGTEDFDPGPGVFTMQSGGANRTGGFVSKFDSSGNFIHAFHTIGTGNSFVLDISSDLNGNIYICGQFSQLVDLNPTLQGQAFKTANGQEDCFIAKYDRSGNYIWGGAWGSTGSDRAMNVEIGPDQRIYVGGSTSRNYPVSPVDFDPTTSINNLTPTQESGFVMKLDTNGSLYWANLIDGQLSDMAIDLNNNINLGGRFSGNADFDPAPSTTAILSSLGGNDGFIVQLDSAGNYIWSGSIGGKSYDEIYRLTSDQLGNIYAIGYFADTADLDPTSGTQLHIANGIYVPPLNANQGSSLIKVNASKSFAWSKAFDYEVFCMEITDQAEIYVGGFFSTTVDLDPGVGTAIYTPHGNREGFVSMFSILGNYQWSSTIVSNDLSQVRQLTSAHNKVLAVGQYRDSADIDLSSNTVMAVSPSVVDVFFSRFQAGGSTVGVEEVIEKPADLSIYPNPFEGELNIRSEEPIQLIEVFDLRGKLISSMRPLDSFQAKLELQARGVFILKVYGEREVVVRKIVSN